MTDISSPPDSLPTAWQDDVDQQGFQQAAEALCHFGRLIYQRDWSPATSSNFSIRLSDGACALTSSGKHKGELTTQDILAVDWEGNAITTGRPSAETLLHTQLYRRDEHIGSVLHTHSKMAVVLSHLWPAEQMVIQGWELQKALEGETTHEGTVTIPLFDNDQNIERLANKVEQYMQRFGQGQAYLIRGHGLYTWAQDIEGCFRHLECLEHLLDYQLELLKLGHKPAP